MLGNTGIFSPSVREGGRVRYPAKPALELPVHAAGLGEGLCGGGTVKSSPRMGGMSFESWQGRKAHVTYGSLQEESEFLDLYARYGSAEKIMVVGSDSDSNI